MEDEIYLLYNKANYDTIFSDRINFLTMTNYVRLHYIDFVANELSYV